MLDCTFRCTVCKGSFREKSAWLEHLLTQEHQKPAIDKGAKWDEDTREGVIVVYSTLPIACMEVLSFFSSFGSVVSDFIWNPTRPKVGVVQYDSKESVDEIFERNLINASSTRSEVRIRNYNFQIKRAANILVFEWQDMILSDDVTPNNTSFINSPSTPSMQNGRASNNGSSTSNRSNPTASSASNSRPSTFSLQNGRGSNGTSNPSTPTASNRPSASTAQNDRLSNGCTSSNAKKNRTINSSSSSSSSDDSSSDSSDAADAPSNSNRVNSSSTSTNTGNRSRNANNSTSNGTNIPSRSSTHTSQRSSDGSRNSRRQSQTNDSPTSTSQTINLEDEIDLKSEPLDASAVAARMDETISSSRVRGGDLEVSRLFAEIFKKVVIPKSRYIVLRDLSQSLKDKLITHYPSIMLITFRHWYLELITMGNPEVLIFVDTQGFFNGAADPAFIHKIGDNINKNEVLAILNSPDFQRTIPGFKRLPEDKRFKLSDRVGTVYLHEPSGLRLNLVFDQGLIPEAQTGRLMRYLTVFDPRAMPLLKVVRYWAKKNKIRFAEYLVTDSRYPNITPEPSAMEWLVMFFLIHEGLIPSPRKICSRPHQELIYRCPLGSVDVGFPLEPGYHETWAKSTPNYATNAKLLQDPDSDAFHLSVLKLAWQFFSFYSFKINRWEPIVFNMRDGEILKISDILHKRPGDGWNTKLEPPEVNVLRNNIPSLVEAKLFLLHPLSMKCSFSLCESTFLKVIRPVMKETAGKIQEAFGKIRKHQQQSRGLLDIDMGSVFTVVLGERIDPAMKKRKGNRGPASSTPAPQKQKKGRATLSHYSRKRKFQANHYNDRFRS